MGYGDGDADEAYGNEVIDTLKAENDTSKWDNDEWVKQIWIYQNHQILEAMGLDHSKSLEDNVRSAYGNNKVDLIKSNWNTDGWTEEDWLQALWLYVFMQDDTGLTGTVWDDITPTQPMREGTQIPKSFNISIDDQEFWVNPNGTKHMYEYITRDAQHIDSFTTSVSSQEMLTEFQAALKDAINKNGVKTDIIIYGGDWEFIIVPPREEGLNYVIKHARYNPQ